VSDFGAAAPASPARAAGWTELATLAGFCAYLFFFGLGSFGLVGADEPRYAQIAREMLARGDWITPTLNGVPWLEKPALYYWSAIVSYKLFGVSDGAARVPSAMFASAMVIAIYDFIRRFRAGMQLDAALIAASCAAVIGFGRGASTDMLLTATLTIGLLAWYRWREGGQTLACRFLFHDRPRHTGERPGRAAAVGSDHRDFRVCVAPVFDPRTRVGDPCHTVSSGPRDPVGSRNPVVLRGGLAVVRRSPAQDSPIFSGLHPAA
jgi:Dolichyl-phosphate-mannose-protein mannosyltransferase